MDVEEQKEPEEPDIERPYEDQMDLLNKMRQHSGDHGSEPKLYGAESLGCLPYYQGFVLQGSLGERDEEIQSSVLEYSVYIDEQHNMADCSFTSPVSLVTHRPCSFAPDSSSVTTTASTVSSVVAPLGPSPMPDTCSPIRVMCCTTASGWDTLRSTSRGPGYSDGDPVSAAAHLHLLGESLSLIGHRLQETNKVVCLPSSLSLLLDSLLCALPPLISLAAQIPEMKSCTCHSLDSMLENIAYLMPGL